MFIRDDNQSDPEPLATMGCTPISPERTIDAVLWRCKTHQMTSENSSDVSDYSYIEVRRSLRVVGFLARYLVFIDGVSVGGTKTGKFVKHSVDAGNHTVKIWKHSGRMSSNLIETSLAPGQTISLVSRSNPSAIFDTFLGGPRHYVDSLRDVIAEGGAVKDGIALTVITRTAR
jgi:hypothetical protein